MNLTYLYQCMSKSLDPFHIITYYKIESRLREHTVFGGKTAIVVISSELIINANFTNDSQKFV